MKQNLKRTLALLMALVICVGLLPTIQIFAANTTVQYVYGSNNYIYNWGTRGDEATFLSPNAEAFYTGSNTYDILSAYAGGTSVSSAPSSALYDELQDLMVSAHKKQTSYNETRTMYQYTDCENSGKVSTKISGFYSGKALGPAWDGGSTWNREHTWPNSKGLGGNDENDIMMLRPTSSSVNSSRGNKAYGESSGYYNPNSASSGKLDLRGDVARIFLYVYVRWGNVNGNSEYGTVWGSKGVIESVDVLLKWMEEDPVDTWELGRNDSVQSITGTRNVFVDYPEFAFILFGEDIPSDMQTPSGEAMDSSACAHNYVAGTAVPATCTSNGYTPYTCTICGATKQENTTAKLPHNFVDGICTICKSTAPKLPLTGDKVVIYAPAYNMALSANKTGYYNVGVDVSGGFENITDAEIWNVTVNSDGTYSFVSGTGKTLAMAADNYTSLNDTGIYDDWTVTQKSGATGIYHIMNTGRGNFLEWYVAKNNWSSFNTSDLNDMFELSFYIIEDNSCKHTTTEVEGARAPTCTQAGATGKTVCADCGETLAESTVIPATGHNYVNGTCTACGAVVGTTSGTTVSVQISQYAEENAWTNSTKYLEVVMDEVISVTASGRDNTGKYYSSGTTWRIYQSEGAQLEVTAADGATINTVTFTYASNNSGVLTYNGANIPSGQTVEVNAESAIFVVGNTGSATNGQARITAIEVTYSTASNVPHEHTPGNAVQENVSAESYDSVVYCTGCGAELSRETVILLVFDPNAKFAQTGLSLGEFIGLQSAVMKSALNAKKFDEAYFIYKQYTTDANGSQVLVNTVRGEYIDKGTYFVADCPVNAKQMSDFYEITPYYVLGDVTYYGETTRSSVKAKAMEKVNSTVIDDQSMKVKALCIAMLNYGAEAQKTFKYSTTNLANAELSASDKRLTYFEDLGLFKKNTIPTTPFMPASSGLSLGDMVYMQFLIKMSDVQASGVLMYQIPGASAVEIPVSALEVYSGAYYIINIPLKAKDVRTEITINLLAQNYQMICSVEAFAAGMEASNAEALICALMDYGDAAKALFG